MRTAAAPKARVRMLSVLREVELEEAGRERAAERHTERDLAEIVVSEWCLVPGLGRRRIFERRRVQGVGMNMVVLQSAESEITEEEESREGGREKDCDQLRYMACGINIPAEKESDRSCGVYTSCYG
jgi:hypothetical protein